ncbi:MAG TPA: SMC-Scp complex subunit ScpB [Thermoanaerobaculia bacterium]|nr:SMC-Scp complex subunit ScpB [Thermoanaerobaculia bacterium]
MSETEVRAAIEAILFVAGEPVRLEDLSETFDEKVPVIAAHIDAIRAGLGERIQGFTVEETAGGFRLATRPEQDPALRKFFAKRGEGRLSIAALETLAIIAYRQPITTPEISELRGVNTSGVLRTLLERRMIRIAGRKNVVGSPFLYRTTRDFLIHFGLNEVQDLPKLDEFSEILGENMTEELFATGSLDEPVSRPAFVDDAGSSEGAELINEGDRSDRETAPSDRQTSNEKQVMADTADHEAGFDDWESDEAAIEEPPVQEPRVDEPPAEKPAFEEPPPTEEPDEKEPGISEPPVEKPAVDEPERLALSEQEGPHRNTGARHEDGKGVDLQRSTTTRADDEVTVESSDTGKTE